MKDRIGRTLGFIAACAALAMALETGVATVRHGDPALAVFTIVFLAIGIGALMVVVMEEVDPWARP